ncbi:MAG: twin-arginine translocase TatA/TatE family subunit [Pseudobdellovibrio sp.]
MLILAIVLIVVIPPEKLPEVMRNIARLFNEFKRSTSGVWDDIKRDAEFKPEDLFKHQAEKNATNTNQKNSATDFAATSTSHDSDPDFENNVKKQSTKKEET